MTAKKLTHRDLKKPDEFLSIFGRVMDWTQDNVAIVAAATAALLLIAIGAVAVVQYRSAESQEASYAYGKAVAEFQAAQELHGEERTTAIKDALDGLKTVYDSHRGTRIADFALISMGQAQFELGNHEQAANMFEQAISQFRDDPNYQALALVSAGKSHEAMRDLKKALDYYQRANAIEGNPYQEVLKNDIGRLSVFRDQMEKAAAAREAQAPAAEAGE